MGVLRYLILVALLVLCPATLAATATWEEEIQQARRLAKEYHEKASARGYTEHAGTMYNELDVEEHTCAILGRMLDKTKLIRHLEKDYPTQSRTGEEFRLAAISISNWAYTAEAMLKLDAARRIKSWNLDCVGRLGIPTSAYIGREGASTFYDIDRSNSADGTYLRVLGDVEAGFSAKLLDAIQQNRDVKYVALGSAGGSVVEAIQAGRLIRRLNLETTLWNNCYSACSLVFLGGVERTIWSPYPALGFHMVSRSGVAEPPNSVVYQRIKEYASDMGVDHSAVINAMLAASPNEFHYMEPKNMCKAGIATWIQRWCDRKFYE
jgi:hypothetical protein